MIKPNAGGLQAWKKDNLKAGLFMKTDLHIHSKCSDGIFSVEEIIREAKLREIKVLSITDHDSISSQIKAKHLSEANEIRYVCGVELNVTFSHPRFREGKQVALDFLGYGFDPNNEALKRKLELMALFREERAEKILSNLNTEFSKEGISLLTQDDLAAIEASVDGVLGRPHIADYLVKKKIVKDRQEAFDKYLVKCDVPKYPLYLEEASGLVRNAGGRLVLAHPNDPHGTSLVGLTKYLNEQSEIIGESMLAYIDGVECWHTRSDEVTTDFYVEFAKEQGLLMTGGSDCHQKPVLMGSVAVPDFVAEQF
jgi:predicted metal-dependent phosphoesterase TrpH